MSEENKKSSLCFTTLQALLFCLPICGTLELFFFLAGLQVFFIAMVAALLCQPIKAFINSCKLQQPLLYKLFLAWLTCSFISLLLLLASNSLILAKVAGSIRQAFILLQIGFFIATACVIRLNLQDTHKLLYAFFAGITAVMNIHFFVLWLGPPAPEGWSFSPLLAANIRDIGNLIEAAIVASLPFALFHHRKSYRLLFTAFYITSWTYIIWSGGRAAIFFTLLITLLFISVAFFQHKKLHILLTPLLGIVIATALSEYFAIFSWNGLGRYFLISEMAAEGTKDLSNGRLEIWQWSITAIINKPWFGNGPFSFFFLPERIEAGFLPDQPHNVILQMLLEWGVIGTAFCLAMLAIFIKLSINNIKPALAQKNLALLGAISAFAVLGIHSFTGGAFWNFQPIVTNLLFLSLILCFSISSKPSCQALKLQ